MTRESRLESVREALRRHRHVVDRPLSWSVTGLAHYLEEAKAALQAAKPEDAEAVRALFEEIERHREIFDLAALQLQLWRQDFTSRSTPTETYSADARLTQADGVRVLAEG